MKYVNKALLVAGALTSVSALALQPPTQEQLERYKKNKTLKVKTDHAKRLGNHIMAPHLLEKANKKLGIHTHSHTKKATEGLYWHRGLPSTGDVKTFTLLIDFTDAPAPAHQTVDVLDNHIYGPGLASRYPEESLTEFYKRSSYGKLNISGEVLGWYRLSQPRTSYTEHADAEVIIREALSHYEQQGHDFSQYDNDGDGYIDYFSVVWTGEIGEWSSFWWGWKSTFGDESYKVSEKSLASFSWQWLSENNATDDFDPKTLIHETGHGLGLPDFYDYDEDIGPDGGIGGLDQMHWYGDHGAFSKFMLGWIEPQVIGSGEQQVTLNPSSSTEDALIIMPELSLDKRHSEYFVVQNRDKELNDTKYPAEGMLIWHVDATATDSGFSYDNSYTDHKLIRLVQADGLDEIEKGISGAEAEDYFQPGDNFTTMTNPDSRSYKIGGTGVEITNINKSGDALTFTANIAEVPAFDVLGISELMAIGAEEVVSVQVADESQVTSAELFVNGTSYSKKTTAPFDFTVERNLLPKGKVKLTVETSFNSNVKNVKDINVLNLDDTYSVVVELGDGFASSFNESFIKNAKNVVQLTQLPDLGSVAVESLLISNTNFAKYESPLSQEEMSRLNDFIQNGGDVYYENIYMGWATDPVYIEFISSLGVTMVGPQDIASTEIVGAEGTILFGEKYSRSTGYTWYQALTASESGNAVPLWQTTEPSHTVAMINQIGNANVIVSGEGFYNIPEDKRQIILTSYHSILAAENTQGQAAKVQLADATYAVSPGDTELAITVTRNKDDESSSDVVLTLTDGTAKLGEHYNAVESNISFAAGELSKVVTIPLLNTNVVDDLTFTATLTGDNLGTTAESTITILGQGAANLSQSTASVSESAGTFNIAIVRQGGNAGAITVNLVTENGSATAGEDYSSVSQDVTFAAGETEKSVTVTITDNTVIDDNRNFTVRLSGDHVVDGEQTMVVTITNNDVAPPPPAEKKSSGGGVFWALLVMFGCLGRRMIKVK